MNNKDIVWILIIIAAIVSIIYAYISQRRAARIKLHKRLKKAYGKRANKKTSLDELEQITHFYKNRARGECVDDISWNDLDMDRVFHTLNNTNSSIGQEYLYKMIRETDKSEEELKKIDDYANSFDEDEDSRFKIQKIFAFIGYAKHMAVSDYVDMIVELKPKSNIANYLSPILLIASLVVLLAINPSIGILLVIVAMIFCVVTYYRFKADVERYFVCINQIVKMIKASKDIVNLDLDFLADSNARLKELSKAFSKIYNNSAMLETGNVTGSISEIIMDYLRMLTHIDLIKFNNMVKLLNNKEQEIYELMDVLGFIESTIAIASFRKSLPYYSVPQFVEGDISINLEEAYHPLIENPVVNSISENGNVLLTGSNASGKSTFLKTVAINAILSQTINTSLSKSYKAPKFRIYSSMALRDDLEANNSYYIVEIKSIKRIFDSLDDNKKPLLIFIDEVLKGTNTVERVAASTQILSSLGKSKAFVFAATHDVELTTLLEKEYENYHFRENVTDDEVLFDYKLHKGPATTRNAIKLLSVLGFDKEIVDKSNERAAYFLENASWKVEI
ncbi:MutS-related protein [Lachnospira pectinoschiza]|uniref:MutS domain V n=1 Tax=Lachnospira pectinoschiza TaxID=28052 RepID=A0A1G9VDA9_9FIRM|nr:ABC transporter ATP-binding protein/permease [Lachnospira pectinoschiza]SDM70027.1 MutS domain V [Lachnospira pectinoschiza]